MFVKFSMILAGATKLLAYMSMIYFFAEFAPRFFTENERAWMFVFFICWILNSYAMTEVKAAFDKLKGK